MRIKALFTAMATLACCLAGPSSAQDFPTRPVRIVSPFPVGSGPETTARLIADRLARYWGQPVTVDARSGGGGFIAVEAVKSGASDGHDLLLVDNGLLTINPSLYKKLPYDVERDFAPAATLLRTPFFVVVGADSPARSTGELIELARAKPGTVSYGSPRAGSTPHLGSALLESLTRTQMIHVPFKETTQLFTAVASGDVSWALGTLATTGPLLRSAKLRLLAVAAPKRAAAMPAVPTVAESGGPSVYNVNAWIGLVARRGTSAAVLLKIRRDVSKALAEPDIQERMASIGFEPYDLSLDEFAALIRTDTRQNADLVARSGATAD